MTEFVLMVNHRNASKADRFKWAREWWAQQYPGSGYIGDAFAHWVAELARGEWADTMRGYADAFATSPEAELYRAVHGSIIPDPTGRESWTYVPDEWSHNPGSGTARVSLGGLIYALRERERSDVDGCAGCETCNGESRGDGR